jgi:hypothetical protein
LKNNYNSYERTADYFAVLFYTSINELHLFKALEKSERADFDSALFFCLFLEISLIKAFIKSNFSIIK